MPFKNYNADGEPINPHTPTSWSHAYGEVQSFNALNANTLRQENLVVMEWMDLKRIVDRAIELEKDQGHKSYIAGMFGIGPSFYSNDEPQDKLTIVLFPVISNTGGAPSHYTDLEFAVDQTGTRDRDNPIMVQQTWIDPTNADTWTENTQILNYFNDL